VGAKLLELPIEHPLQEKLTPDFEIPSIEANPLNGPDTTLIAKIEGRMVVVEVR
jgi:hypothetical protein